MKAVILQPSYIPWRGYFDQIKKADIFIFYDCVQYDKAGWRNRNQIKTSAGLQWLTIPVHAAGAVSDRLSIKDIEIAYREPWQSKHWSSIEQNYSKAPFFDDYSDMVHGFFDDSPKFLADFTIETTLRIASALGIEDTKFVRSSEMGVARGEKSQRLIHLLKGVGASHYISGPSAKGYLDIEAFEAAEIEIEFMEYQYPSYPQIRGEFEARVSVLDLLFNTGPHAYDYF